MLQTLDPHSSFMDPRSYAQMRERQEGRYYGLGITIQAPDGDITAVRVFEGSPAYDKGIRRGDVIAEIEGETPRAGRARTPSGQAARPEGHVRQHRHAPQGPRRADRPRGQPRRDQHPEPPRGVHDRRPDRLRAHQDFAEHTDEDLGARSAS
jgi:hypothetical protein